jgi:hypothetical protein
MRGRNLIGSSLPRPPIEPGCDASALRCRSRLGAVFCWPAPSGAEPPPTIGVELNRLEDQGGNCRAYLVVANPGAGEFSGFALDLVVFDWGGTIMRRLAVDVARCGRRNPWSRCSTSQKPRVAPSAASSSTMSFIAAMRAAMSQGASIGYPPRRNLRLRC